ncbi:unnamed protein product [Effrenium voratum]|nr:unnamed protein product [Effrenium voratum]
MLPSEESYIDAVVDNADQIGSYSGPIRGQESGPFLFSSEHLHGKRHPALLPPTGRFAGALWYNSLFWPNFPELRCLEECDTELLAGLRQVNSDGHLSEQYVTFAAAREDLCNHSSLPQEPLTIHAEVLQYDGVRENHWRFPLQDFIPKRGHHTPYECQSRRSYENGVITLGLNAEEFSDSVLPVSDLDVHITLSAEPAVQRHAREGHSFVLLKLGGWPYRVRRLGTFEGLGDGGRIELQLGSGDFREEALWQLLGLSGEEECGRTGCKYWCQLYELDWLGPKWDESLAFDPEIPLEKGFVWFRVLEGEQLPSGRAVRVQLLEDGVVPAWLDLSFLQVWAGDIPLGYLNKAVDEIFEGRVQVIRTVEDGTDGEGIRKVQIVNSLGSLAFDDPFRCSVNQIVDLGWSIHDVCYRGARLSLGPQPGAWR